MFTADCDIVISTALIIVADCMPNDVDAIVICYELPNRIWTIIIIHYYVAQNLGDIAIVQVNRLLSLMYDYPVDLHNSIQMTDVILLQMLVMWPFHRKKRLNKSILER